MNSAKKVPSNYYPTISAQETRQNSKQTKKQTNKQTKSYTNLNRFMSEKGLFNHK